MLTSNCRLVFGASGVTGPFLPKAVRWSWSELTSLLCHRRCRTPHRRICPTDLVDVGHLPSLRRECYVRIHQAWELMTQTKAAINKVPWCVMYKWCAMMWSDVDWNDNEWQLDASMLWMEIDMNGHQQACMFQQESATKLFSLRNWQLGLEIFWQTDRPSWT